jgi:hypothetical protein
MLQCSLQGLLPATRPEWHRQRQHSTPTRMVSDGTHFLGGQAPDRQVRWKTGLWERIFPGTAISTLGGKQTFAAVAN